MALIKCPSCGNDVSSKAEQCPNCHNKISSITAVNRNIEEERIINFFITYATVTKILSFIIAFIVFIAAISMAEDTDGFSLITGIIMTISLIISGIVVENIFKWKAYMLKNTCEINNKNR